MLRHVFPLLCCLLTLPAATGCGGGAAPDGDLIIDGDTSPDGDPAVDGDPEPESDGDGEADPADPDPEPDIDPEAEPEQECEPRSTRCVEGRLAECRPDGSGWSAPVTCPGGQICFNDRCRDDDWTTALPVDGEAYRAAADPLLDLLSQVAMHAPEAGPAPVLLPPELVVGEGPDPAAHTVVRILDRHGLARAQFLAFWSWVRGGVEVHAGALLPSGAGILALPASDPDVLELRIFSTDGALRNRFIADPVTLAPPFAAAVADFIPANPGDEIALASKRPQGGFGRVSICRPDGQTLLTLPPPIEAPATGERVGLAAVRSEGTARLLIHYRTARRAWLYAADGGLPVEIDLSAIPDGAEIHPPIFPGQALSASAPDPERSWLWGVATDGAAERIDVGERENRFWVRPVPGDGIEESGWVRQAREQGFRTDLASPGYDDPDIDATADDHWAGGPLSARIDSLLAGYGNGTPVAWTTGFSNRHPEPLPDHWSGAIDPESGLPRFVQLSRSDSPLPAETAGESGMRLLTLAPGVEPLNRLFLLPARAWLRALAVRFRDDPSGALAVLPAGRLEIGTGPDGTIGDYNPAMVRGFRQRLLERYDSVEGVNTRFGASFADEREIDAPRADGRGEWDRYLPANPYFEAWVAYNHDAASARGAGAVREALLAGLPPALVSVGPVPGIFAWGPVTESRRFSPVGWSWAAGTAAAVAGDPFDRLWYRERDNWAAAAFASGHVLTAVTGYRVPAGQYQGSISQARLLWDSGVSYLGVDQADEAGWETVRAGYRSLIDIDRPRTAAAGGTGQLRPACLPIGDPTCTERAIVCVGTGERPGLLKSVGPDGSFDGTVYVQPFRARVGIEAPVEERRLVVSTGRWDGPPVEGLDAGDLLELRFLARGAGESARLLLEATHAGQPMAGQSRQLTVGSAWRSFRFTLAISDRMDPLALRLTPAGDGPIPPEIVLDDLSLIVHREQAARPERGTFRATPHAGGVFFDLLPSQP